MNVQRLFKAILYTLIVLLPASCQWFSPAEEKIDRSLLIYIVGASDLTSSIKSNLKDIKNSPFVPEEFNINKESGDVLVILEHFQNDIPRLKRVYKDKYGVVNEEILVEYPDRSSIDASFFREVLVYTNSLFPAEEPGLLVSSHGSGWTPVGFYKKPTKGDGVTPMSVEEDPYAHLVKSFGVMEGKELDVMEMADALPIRYSYLIFDACLMGGIEVAYEFKEKADYIVFSPTEIMAAGFPYPDLMEQVFYSEGALLDRVTSLAKCYYDFYDTPSSGGGTISVVRTEKLPAVALAAKSIFSRDRDRISTLNMSSIQRYFRGSKAWFYDLTHFMEKISSDQNLYDSFCAAMNEAVVAKYSTDYFITISIENYSGLSTYIPKPDNPYLNSYYKGFAWNQEVGMVQ